MMQSTMGRDIYEKGLEQGLEQGLETGMAKGLEKGLQQGMGIGLSSTLIKQLTKRFGVLPDELKNQIRSLDVDTLESLLGDVMDYQNLEEVKHLLKS